MSANPFADYLVKHAPRARTPDEIEAGVTQEQIRERERRIPVYTESGELTPEAAAHLGRSTNGNPFADYLTRSRDPVRLLSVDDLGTLPPPAWLIEGILPAGGLTMLHGHPGAGKSFLMLDWSLTLAAGLTSWCGRDTRPGRVVYVAAEAARSIGPRVAAWRGHHAAPDALAIQFVPGPVQLMDPLAVPDLLAAIRANEPEPALVVFDTFGKCLLGGDDNSSKDVGTGMANLDAIRRETGAGVVFAHHNVKSGDGERGSGVFRADVDAAALLSLQESGARRLRCGKVRDGEPFADMEFTLEASEDSAVLVPTDGTTQSLEERLVTLAKLSPGLNVGTIRARLGVRKERLLEALTTCSRNRSLRLETSGRQRRVWPC